MKILLFLFAFQAHAAVTPFFKEDGSQASFLLAGMPGDQDAPGLWNAMVVAPENFQGKLAKKMFLAGPDGKHLMDADCVFSTMIQNYGSCTVILRATPGMIEVNKTAGTARMWLSGAAAAEFAKQFVSRDQGSVLYRSSNGRLNITVARDRDVVTDLVVDWR